MYWLYRPLIAIYFYSIRIAALFNAKARAWSMGRKNWKRDLNQFVETSSNKTGTRIWIHASSLGEFEQGRELIEIIRTNNAAATLILSLFSPSGYEKCKNYDQVDYVCYFPSDIYSEIRYFIERIKPDLAIFIKYDFWFNTLDVLQNKNIPYYFISSIFRSDHYLLHPVFSALLKKLKLAEKIFLQNDASFQLLKKAGFTNIEVCGDTRLDRVYRIANYTTAIPGLEFFCDREKIFIAGSTWFQDLEVIADAIQNAINHNWKIIIVPHVTDEADIQIIENVFQGQTIRYSKLSSTTSIPILIIDRVGLLSRLYRHCFFAYVGGGFGRGIHNILEPAAYKKAICIGPNYHKFQEALDFIESGIAFKIENPTQLDKLFNEIPMKQESIRLKLEQYFQNNLGASERIYEKMELNDDRQFDKLTVKPLTTDH